MEPVLLTEGFPTVCLYPATSPERPLIVLNSFAEEGDRVAEACSDLDLSLLILRDLHWDDDLSPWPAPALSKKDPPCSGGADAEHDGIVFYRLDISFLSDGFGLDGFAGGSDTDTSIVELPEFITAALTDERDHISDVLFGQLLSP